MIRTNIKQDYISGIGFPSIVTDCTILSKSFNTFLQLFLRSTNQRSVQHVTFSTVISLSVNFRNCQVFTADVTQRMVLSVVTALCIMGLF